MKRLLSIKYKPWAFNLAMLILRVGVASHLVPLGYDKLMHFQAQQKGFMNFLGLGEGVSLALVIFAEFFCSLFLIFGLFSRLVVIPILIEMVVLVFKEYNLDIFNYSTGGHAALVFVGLLPILLVGPGKISVDGMINK